MMGNKGAVDDAIESGLKLCFHKIEQDRNGGIIHLPAGEGMIRLPFRWASDVVEERFLDSVFAEIRKLEGCCKPFPDSRLTGCRSPLHDNDRIGISHLQRNL